MMEKRNDTTAAALHYNSSQSEAVRVPRVRAICAGLKR
jgi:hypothetical protein